MLSLWTAEHPTGPGCQPVSGPGLPASVSSPVKRVMLTSRCVAWGKCEDGPQRCHGATAGGPQRLSPPEPCGNRGSGVPHPTVPKEDGPASHRSPCWSWGVCGQTQSPQMQTDLRGLCLRGLLLPVVGGRPTGSLSTGPGALLGTHAVLTLCLGCASQESWAGRGVGFQARSSPGTACRGQGDPGRGF